MATIEVNWNREMPDGTRRQACAHRIGKTWIFYSRAKRFDAWDKEETPALAAWLELLDGVRRRVGRHLARKEDIELVTRCIRERFPGADIK